MANIAHTPASSSGRAVLAGRILSGLAIAFLVMDAGMKIAAIPAVAETSAQLGWTVDVGFWRGMGVLLLVLTALFAWPRTAFLGAVLLTAYLGGAVATHVRVGSPLFSHVLFGVYLGAIMWSGLWLRSPALRNLAPFAKMRDTGFVEEFPRLAAYHARATERPAYQRALAAQLADFDGEPPKQGD